MGIIKMDLQYINLFAKKGDVKEMAMNETIQKRRKELGLTQEQVAEYLGVSTPAVSKWEKGVTSPDITLLPPLARLLKMDLNTLFGFGEDLTPEEIGEFCRKLAQKAGEDIAGAFDEANAKLHEYPHNEQLLLNVALLLESKLLQTSKAPTHLDVVVEEWYRRLSGSAEKEIKNSADFMRVSRYLRQGKTEAAREILEGMEDNREWNASLPDKVMLQVSMYMQQGKPEEAALLLEKEIYNKASKMQMLLTKLMEAEDAAGREEDAKAIAGKIEAMVDAFDLWEYNRYVPTYFLAEREKNADVMLPLLDKMLTVLQTPWPLEDSVLYHRMAPETKAPAFSDMKSFLLNQLESDPEYAYLHRHPDYERILGKYKN